MVRLTNTIEVLIMIVAKPSEAMLTDYASQEDLLSIYYHLDLYYQFFAEYKLAGRQGTKPEEVTKQ